MNTNRHRKVTLLVSLILSVIALLAIVAALAADRDRLMRELRECAERVDAKACVCSAEYQLPEDGVSTPLASPRLPGIEAHAIYAYFAGTEYADVADIIVAMSILETGWYRSTFHAENFNYFSTKRKPDGVTCVEGGEKSCFSIHRSLKESCAYTLKGVFRKRGYRTDRDGFLDDLVNNGYAEDPDYVKKVQSVLRRIAKDKSA